MRGFNAYRRGFKNRSVIVRIIENDSIPENDGADDFSADKKFIYEDIAEEIIEMPEEIIDKYPDNEVSDEFEIEIEEIFSDSSLDPATEKETEPENEEKTVTEEEPEAEEENKAEETDGAYAEDNLVEKLFSDSTEGSETEKKEAEAEEAPEAEKEVSFFSSLWKNHRRRAKLAYAMVMVIMLLVGTGYGFVNAILDRVESDDTDPTKNYNELGEEIIYDDEDFDLFSAVNSAGSVNDYINQWYDSGESMHSKNVINVLLVGLDSKDGLQGAESRSDTMMVVSLNTKTKKISMVSLFRDTWAKFVPSDGTVHYGKMNGSYRYGGINCTVQTIEKMFKIKIDHYAIVDFRNFKKLVNAVGGVDLYVQEYEAKNMKREWDIDVDFSKDENDLIHLNGEQAFWFARQRHSDGDADVSRTRRQRQVITAFIDSCRGASFTQLSDALNSVFSFIKTDLTKTEILGYATKALAWGWLSYPIETITISDHSIFQTPTLFGASIVIQDYPKVAQIIQEGLYGSSNIVLDSNRKIIFSLY